MAWRYIAERLLGDGTAELIHPDLPLEGVAITRELSGPSRLTGELSLSTPGLHDADGNPLIEQWSTAIYAVDEGDTIRGGFILVVPTFRSAGTEVDCIGFAGYPQGMPYTESWFGVQVDPLDVVRRIWDHLQGQPRGNLGMVVDGTTSPLRIGEELEVVDFETGLGEKVSFEAGPVKLNWYTDVDLGRKIDDLARDTPFDYWEDHTFNADGTISHRLGLAYPRRGRRRHDLRFVVGENIALEPDVITEGEDYANFVLGLGAGEGRDMVHVMLPREDGRLRRAAVASDKTAKSKRAITDFVRSELARRAGLLSVEEISVWEHDNAPLGSWVEGDEINIRGDVGDGISLDIWCRITATTITPEEPTVATLSVVRTEAT